MSYFQNISNVLDNEVTSFLKNVSTTFKISESELLEMWKTQNSSPTPVQVSSTPLPPTTAAENSLLKLSKSELEESEHQEEGEGEHPDESLINDKSNEENPLEETSNPMHNDRDYYRKLNIQQLKTIVSSKGLSTDVQKLKKNDLIKILENTTNS